MVRLHWSGSWKEPLVGYCEHGNVPSMSIKAATFLISLVSTFHALLSTMEFLACGKWSLEGELQRHLFLSFERNPWIGDTHVPTTTATFGTSTLPLQSIARVKCYWFNWAAFHCRLFCVLRCFTTLYQIQRPGSVDWGVWYDECELWIAKGVSRT
jgi:hypothetical protein